MAVSAMSSSSRKHGRDAHATVNRLRGSREPVPFKKFQLPLRRQLVPRAQRERRVVWAVADGKAGGDRDVEARAEPRENVLERFVLLENFAQRLLLGAAGAGEALVVLVFAVGEVAEHDGRRAVEHAGLLELNHHAVDAVKRLVDVLEEDDLSLARLRKARTGQGGPERK